MSLRKNPWRDHLTTAKDTLDDHTESMRKSKSHSRKRTEREKRGNLVGSLTGTVRAYSIDHWRNPWIRRSVKTVALLGALYLVDTGCMKALEEYTPSIHSTVQTERNRFYNGVTDAANSVAEFVGDALGNVYDLFDGIF